MFKGIKAVIFDIDGTLLDSMGIWTDIDDIFVEKYKLNPPDTFHSGMEGKSYSETAEYFLELFPELPHTSEELQEEWYHMAVDIYRKDVKMKQGAYEFLHDLKEKGFKLGLATSNQRELATVGLEAHGVFELFDVLRTACEVKAGKPAPDVYLSVAEELGVSPSGCLVFEDVPMGILAGKNAGMKVCAVDDWFSASQNEKKKQLADYFIHNYDDIKNKTYEVL